MPHKEKEVAFISKSKAILEREVLVLVHIIVDEIMCEIEGTGRKKAESSANKAILTTAFATGVQLGVFLVNYSGKAISMIKNSWNAICNNLTKRFYER